MTHPLDTFTTRAWSCSVRLVVGDERVLRRAAADLVALLADIDAQASRFRCDSALERANARAGRPTAIPKLLVRLVAAALDAARCTDGAVDPTLGGTLSALGYDRDICAVAPDGPAITVPARGRDWRSVGLHREAGLLTVPVGTALDLGATAKAWTADHAARRLSARYDTAVLVELGGDLAVAGQRAGGWCVRVAEREDGPGADLLLVRRGGVATSTTTVRTWRRGGSPVHHIVDPRTGRPADGPWRTATVAADSCLLANTASTAAIVLGDAALGWLESAGLAARLVGPNGAVTTTSRWPAPRRTTAAPAVAA